MQHLMIFLAAAMFLDGAAAQADALRVPGDYATIQAAIDAARRAYARRESGSFL